MENIIRIKGAAFYAYHGAMKEEQEIGGKFEADVEMFTDFSKAAQNDDLEQTVNYHEVYKFISSIVNGKKYYLIESIATTIADGILEKFPNVNKVGVIIKKHSVPVGGMLDHVEVEINKARFE